MRGFLLTNRALIDLWPLKCFLVLLFNLLAQIMHFSCFPLSLYSTRPQNIWRRVLLRHLTQKIVLLRHLTQGYQHVGIFGVR